MFAIKSQLVKDSVFQLSAQTASRIFSFVSTIIIARTLGVSGYGILVYSITIAQFLSIFVEYGLAQYIIREIARNKSNVTLFLDAIVLKTAQWVLGCAAILLLSYFTGIFQKNLLIIALVLPFFDILYLTSISLFNGLKQFQYSSIFNLCYDGIRLILVSIASVWFKNITLILIGYIASSFLTSLIVLLYIYKRNIIGTHTMQMTRSMSLYKESFWFFIYALLFQLYFKIDVIMINYYRNSEEVGKYIAAYKLFEVFLFIPALLMGVLFPRFSSLSDNKERLLTNAKQIQVVLVNLLFPLVIIIFAFSGLLITVLYGSNFNESATTLKIVIVTLALYLSNCIFPVMLTSQRLEKKCILAFIIGMSFNIILNMVAIPRYGAEGAGAATVLSEVLVTVLYLLFVKNYIGEFVYLSRIYVPWILIISFLLMMTMIPMSSIFIIYAVLTFIVVYYSAIRYYGKFDIAEFYAKMKSSAW
jgi:O-antigen/teichoic acid export membrane protein